MCINIDIPEEDGRIALAKLNPRELGQEFEVDIAVCYEPAMWVFGLVLGNATAQQLNVNYRTATDKYERLHYLVFLDKSNCFNGTCMNIRKLSAFLLYTLYLTF